MLFTVYLNCKAFGGSRVKTRRCISRQEDVFEQTCVVYLGLLVSPSVGRGLRLEDVTFEKNLCCLLNCKAFGGSRVKTRRCISRPRKCILGNFEGLLSCKALWVEG